MLLTNIKQIFVVGNSRSGTTMMGRILGNHSDVVTFKELHFFGQLWTSGDKNNQLNRKESVKLFSRLLCINKHGIFSQVDLHQFNSISEAELSYECIYALDIFKRFLEYSLKVKNHDFDLFLMSGQEIVTYNRKKSSRETMGTCVGICWGFEGSKTNFDFIFHSKTSKVAIFVDF